MEFIILRSLRIFNNEDEKPFSKYLYTFLEEVNTYEILLNMDEKQK